MGGRSQSGVTVVSSGQTLSGITVSGHETLKVEAGGTIENIVASGDPGALLAGPFVTVFGSAYGTTIAGAVMSVVAGGSAFDTVVSAGGSVTDDGLADGSTVGSAGYFYEYGLASGTQVLDGGEFDVNGTAANTVVASGGFIELSGKLEGCTVQSGGQIEDYGGGVNFSGVVVSAGGALLALPSIDVSSGSVAENTEVKAGGTLITTPGGSIGGLTIDAGAVVIAATDLVFAAANGVVVAAGNDLRGTVLGIGQYETVFAGGVAFATTLVPHSAQDGADTWQIVESGGRAQGTSVGAGGIQYVVGTANATDILSGGQQDIYGGSTMSTVIALGGVQSGTGAAAMDTVVDAGGLMQGDFAARDTLISGGTMYMEGGQATDTVIRGGVQEARENARADATWISAGGTQTLSDSAQADATTVYAGGEQRVTGARAVASSTRIAGSGMQLVTGGSAVSATIGAGGVQDVTSFGSAEATTLERGGLLMDGLNDAIVSNVTFLQGGTLDFPTLVFVSGASASVNATDVLTVQDGAQSASVQLAGSYTGDRFSVGPDAGSGSFVTLSAAQEIGMPLEVGARVWGTEMALAEARGAVGGFVAGMRADVVDAGFTLHPFEV